MHPSRLLLILAACSFPILSVSASSMAETRESIRPGELEIQDVEMEDVLVRPQAFLNVRIRFHCIFAEIGNVFDVQHTYFKPEQFSNLIVWDDRANLGDPVVRSQPVISMYLSKNREATSQIIGLKKYQSLELVGEVTGGSDDSVSFSIHQLRSLDGVGAYTEAAVYHLEQAAKLSAESSYDLAEDHYAAAVVDNLPQSAQEQIAYARAKNLNSWGHFEASAAILRSGLALVQDDKGVDSQMVAGMHYLLAKSIIETIDVSTPVEVRSARLAEAVDHARTAVAIDPGQGDAYAVLGITLAGMGQFDEARRQCEKAIRLRPTIAEVRWYLGRILDQQGSYEEAIDALRKAIDLTPKDHRIHKAIGGVYLHRALKGGPKASDDFVTALREYDIAVRLNNADAEAHTGAGQVLEAATGANADVQTGSSRQPATYAMAVDRYKGALAADPKYAPAHRALANRYRADNQPELAIEQLKAIIATDPKREDGYNELGSYLWSLERKDEAFAVYESLYKANPESLTALYTLAHVSVDIGKYDQAQKLLDQLLKKDKRFGPAYLDLAVISLKQGQPKPARKYAKQALDYLAEGPAKDQARAIIAQVEGPSAAPAKPPAP